MTTNNRQIARLTSLLSWLLIFLILILLMSAGGALGWLITVIAF